MNKFNNKGFLMIEVIVVTTLITLFSIILYSFTNTTIQKFEIRDTYNTAESLYKSANLKSYYYRKDYVAGISSLVSTNNLLYDITSMYDDEFLISLKQIIGVDKIYITKYGLSESTQYDKNSGLDFLGNNVTIKEGLKYFINWIPENTVDQSTNVYRLIVAFNDKTYATIKL